MIEKYKQIDKDFLKVIKKVYLKYGKIFPPIYDHQFIYTDEFDANNWKNVLNYTSAFADQGLTCGECHIFNYKDGMNIFKDDFIEWMMNG